MSLDLVQCDVFVWDEDALAATFSFIRGWPPPFNRVGYVTASGDDAVATGGAPDFGGFSNPGNVRVDRMLRPGWWELSYTWTGGGNTGGTDHDGFFLGWDIFNGSVIPDGSSGGSSMVDTNSGTSGSGSVILRIVSTVSNCRPVRLGVDWHVSTNSLPYYSAAQVDVSALWLACPSCPEPV